MRCPRCRHENRPQAKFCEECSAPLAGSCPSCGTPLSSSVALTWRSRPAGGDQRATLTARWIDLQVPGDDWHRSWVEKIFLVTGSGGDPFFTWGKRAHRG
jgi:Double zinc ribbon